jgi:diguanylate cyclase (GGDEF)-like protein
MSQDHRIRGACVLVVDDDPAVRAALIKTVVAAGHRGEAVATSAAAHARLAAGDVDVALCELRLRGEDGLDVVRAIAAGGPGTVAVAVTGLDDPEVASRAFDAGAVGYVVKPFTPTDIAIALQQALRRRDTAAREAERRLKTETELRHRADFDALTGLHNRRRFGEELDLHLRSGGRGAVLMCDLDHFKLVNDSLGHAAGDDVLRRTARILRSRLRSNDIVARFGGDEFAVVLTDLPEDRGLRVARELQRLLSDPADRPATGASIGLVCFDEREPITGDDLMLAADAALYEAKEAGRNRVVRFSGPKASSLTWVERIRAALHEDRLVLHAQPIVDLRTGDVACEELLVRMLGEDGTVIPPGDFLPTAERFGFIEQIDAWTMGRGLDLTASGRAVSVNVSARTIQAGDVVDMIEARVAGGLDASRLTLEITETSAVSNMEIVRALAERLAAMGCRLALDDFGTGFGGFTYLKHLPIDFIKIDREFVRDLARNRADQRMIRAMVEIARADGQLTIAEGVEDVVALDMLRRSGVDCAQGYYLGRPALLAERPRALAHGAAQLYGSLATTPAA